MDAPFKRRAIFVCLLMVAGLSLLSMRLLKLQVWEPVTSESQSVSGFPFRRVIPASNGFIVDRNDVVIAQNRPEATLVADVKHLKTPSILRGGVAHRYASQYAGWNRLNEAEQKVIFKKAWRKVKERFSDEELIEEHLAYATEIIGRELRVSSEDLVKKIEQKSARAVLKKRIREDVARKLESELETRRIQGFSFERSQRRDYPMSTFAPHLIGFRDSEGRGVAGLEKSHYDILRGQDGVRELARDERGHISLTGAARVTPPKMGKHVKITLDMGIQAIIEEELEMAFQAYNAKNGSVIVVDPHTGDILAMASRPHFDLNVRENYAEAGESFAISAQYEAGSVMKIVAMAAALDQKRATRETVVHCGWGKLPRYGFVINDHHSYGELTFDEVMLKSSNTGTFQFAEMVGREGFYDYLAAFGFGQRTGFPIPGEARGKAEASSNMREFASATYGYATAVTPLQLAMAYAVIANGGRLLKPRLIDSIIANGGVTLQQTPVQEVRRVISEAAASDMRLALEQVIKHGTGRRGQVLGYRAGGKTGTARKWDNNAGQYSADKKYLTFCGMVPVENPRFVCVVTIDEPTDLGEDFEIGGGTVAAPIFAQTAGRIARYLNIAPTEELPLAQSPSE